MTPPAYRPWFPDAGRLRVGLIDRAEATRRGVPHIPAGSALQAEFTLFADWVAWNHAGRTSPRPPKIPANYLVGRPWAKTVLAEYEKKHPKKPTPPATGPPPKPAPPPSSQGSHPERWVGLGFVATAENAAPSIYAGGPIQIVCPQIAVGLFPPDNDPNLDATRRLIASARALGMGVAGWAWCANADRADVEGRYHAKVALDLALPAFVANMEEPYDAHGNSSDPRYLAPDVYAREFRVIAPNLELGVTTTPRWASSGNGLRAAGATMMPQAFTGEVPSATIPACVEHARAWGWPNDRIRPLVQVYETNGARPDADAYNADAFTYGVGVVPYILEQAHDGDGQQMIRTLAPAITRQPKP